MIPWPALPAVGAVTKAPPCEPSRISTRPVDSRTRNASRSESLLTPSCSQSSRSGAAGRPIGSAPLLIMFRSWATIVAEVRVADSGANAPTGTFDSSTLGATAASPVASLR